MKKAVTISRQTVDAAFKHLREGVNLQDLNVTPEVSNRIKRVKYVLDLHEQNVSPFAIFKKLAAGRYNNASEEWHVAKKDEALYNRINEQLTNNK